MMRLRVLTLLTTRPHSQGESKLAPLKLMEWMLKIDGVDATLHVLVLGRQAHL